MKKFFFLFIILIVIPVFAGEIYIWTDKKGMDHITTSPPPPWAKIKDSSLYRESSQEEIAEYERARRSERARMEREESYKKVTIDNKERRPGKQTRIREPDDPVKKRQALAEIAEIRLHYSRYYKTKNSDMALQYRQDRDDKFRAVCQKYEISCVGIVPD